MDWDYSGKLEPKLCKYCREEFKPNTKRQTNCIKCQFSDTRRKRFAQTNKKIKNMIILK